MEFSLANILVFVPDLEAADAFYEGVLGLRRERSGDLFRRLRGPNFELVLFRCAEAGSSAGYSDRAGSAICLSVPSIREAMAYLEEHDVKLLHSDPQPGDGLSYVAFEDPFGTVHEIVEYTS